MVLAILFSSLPRILKLSIDAIWPLMFWWWYIGEGVFKCSLNLSPKVLPDSPTYSSSYDVSALFTSIPIPSALDIINNKLQEDTDLHNRTNMTAHNIIELLDFCLNNTYFIFQGVFYKQTKGAAMGSPVSPIVANIFMEAFESRVLATAIHPPKLWRRYVDDTCVLQDQSHKEEFLQHINSVDNVIQFTIEEAKEDGSIPFLDTLITPEQNGTFSIGSIENQHTQTSIYLGTATTICQPSIVSLRP